jgi:hypothetical protein
VEEGLTTGKPEDATLTGQQLDGIAGGTTVQTSGDRTLTSTQPVSIVGSIPTSKLMPE